MASDLSTDLAALLERAGETRSKVVQPVPASNSPAHIDQQYAIRKTGGPKASDRLILVADVFTAVASDQLGALSSLVRGGKTIFGLFPLMRAVVENSVGVLWVLDPEPTHQQRWARAGLAEYDAISRDLEMVAHWLPKGDQGRTDQKAQRTILRKELEAVFPLPNGIESEDVAPIRKLDSAPFALNGETIPKIENNISAYLDEPGSTTWKGVYGYLCARGTHASLGSARYITGSSLGTGFDLSAAQLVWLVRATLSAYGRALEHLVQWCGWDDAPVNALIDEVALLDPEMHTAQPDDG